MREIGPHKYKSYITPPNYDNGEHWLSATDYSEKVKVMLENEPKKEQYIGMLEKNLQDEYLPATSVSTQPTTGYIFVEKMTKFSNICKT